MTLIEQHDESSPPAVRAAPARHLPGPQVLSRFSVEDRTLLSRILTEPQQFVPHPSFADSTTAAELYGDSADAFHAPQAWCNAADVPDAISAGPVPTKGCSLTGEQERALFLRLNYARYRLHAVVSRAEQRRLNASEASEVLQWHLRSEAARIAIVQANMPLVLAMAKRARLGNVDYAELISEGNMALLRSVDKFDCGRGFKFSTYGCRAILKSFSRVAIRSSRYRARFPAEFDPTLERSDFLDHTRDAVESGCVSELREILHKNRAELTEVEQRVLSARFALDAKPDPELSAAPRTLEQVGLLIGVTKERVRQIQNKALAKLKAALEESILAA